MSFSPRTLHFFAQDGVPWRGLGVIALVLGGVVFLLLLGFLMGLRFVFEDSTAAE